VRTAETRRHEENKTNFLPLIHGTPGQVNADWELINADQAGKICEKKWDFTFPLQESLPAMGVASL
jgi:hypothetical protein